MTTYRLFPSTSGPASSIVTTNNDIFNTGFKVTSWGLWLNGYYYWAADAAQGTGARKFCLWAMTGAGAGALAAGSTVTSAAAFTLGWNYVPLPVPVPLSSQFAYRAATGLQGNFPFTASQFGGGQPYAAGITNGPLSAYSDTGGGAPEPLGNPQCTFDSSIGSDPTQRPVTATSSSFNAWLDVQAGTVPPVGTSYRLFPNMPVPYGVNNDTADNFTLGCEFILSASCALNRVWFYSNNGMTQLPTECGIWSTATSSLVTGTHAAAPFWSGQPGSGWVSCAYNGPVLAAGEYKVAVFNGAQVPAVWNSQTALYWSTGPGSGGITTGPLSAPDAAGATAPGQSTYHLGAAFAFPDTAAGPFNYWVDVEVTPASPPLLMTTQTGGST